MVCAVERRQDLSETAALWMLATRTLLRVAWRKYQQWCERGEEELMRAPNPMHW